MTLIDCLTTRARIEYEANGIISMSTAARLIMLGVDMERLETSFEESN